MGSQRDRRGGDWWNLLIFAGVVVAGVLITVVVVFLVGFSDYKF